MKNGHERPVNRLAAGVVSEGCNFEYRVKEGTVCSPFPLAVRSANSLELSQSTFIDLTGRKCGRLTVIGISDEAKARWVCRCSCGLYVMRTSKAIKSASASNCCYQCKMLAAAKGADHYRRTGKKIGMEKFL